MSELCPEQSPDTQSRLLNVESGGGILSFLNLEKDILYDIVSIELPAFYYKNNIISHTSQTVQIIHKYKFEFVKQNQNYLIAKCFQCDFKFLSDSGMECSNIIM